MTHLRSERQKDAWPSTPFVRGEPPQPTTDEIASKSASCDEPDRRPRLVHRDPKVLHHEREEREGRCSGGREMEVDKGEQRAMAAVE